MDMRNTTQIVENDDLKMVGATVVLVKRLNKPHPNLTNLYCRN